MKMKNLTRAVVLLLLMSVLFASFCGCERNIGNEDTDNTEPTPVDSSDTTVESNVLDVKEVLFYTSYSDPLLQSNLTRKATDNEVAISELLALFPEISSYSDNLKIDSSDIDASYWRGVIFVDNNDETIITVKYTSNGDGYIYDGSNDYVYKMTESVPVDRIDDIIKKYAETRY